MIVKTFFSVILCTILISGGISDSVPILLSYQANITLKIGSNMNIICPISSQSNELGLNTIIFSWSVKDIDENQVYRDPRYSFTNASKIISIREVKQSDSGVYKCRGVTGFGSQEATFYVNILESQSCMPHDPLTSQTPQRPCFLDPTMQASKNKVKTIHKNVGSSVEFRCDAGGNPKPSYKWFSGKSIADWIVGDVRRPFLKITDLRREYTGHYSCRVSNSIGEVSFTFALVVKDSPSPLPKIVDELQNKSVTIGSSAELSGSISCKCSPIIQWLQRVSTNDAQTNPTKNRKSLISIPQAAPSEVGEFFITLDQDSLEDGIETETLTQSNGLIVSKLKFHSVKPWQSGKYVLLTMSKSSKENVHEINYKTVFLNTVPDKLVPPPSKASNPPKIIVYIAVPLGILILCVLVVLYCFIRKRNSSSRHSIIGAHSMKSKRSISSNNHSMSIGGLDSGAKACLKHNSYGTPALMTMTTSVNSTNQYNPPTKMNSNTNGPPPPYILQGQMVSSHATAPAPSTCSSISHNNSSIHKVNLVSNNSSNESSALYHQPLTPPSNSPYSYSNGQPYNVYHQYSHNSINTDYQPNTSVPSNNPSVIGNDVRDASSNSSDFSSQLNNRSNPSVSNNNSMIRHLSTTPYSIDCQCPNQYFIPDLSAQLTNNSQFKSDLNGQHFQLPPSLCFDNDSSYPSNQYHASAAYFPGHNSSSSASLTYS